MLEERWIASDFMLNRAKLLAMGSGASLSELLRFPAEGLNQWCRQCGESCRSESMEQFRCMPNSGPQSVIATSALSPLFWRRPPLLVALKIDPSPPILRTYDV